jgi:Glycosyl Hydrolase Family 88
VDCTCFPGLTALTGVQSMGKMVRDPEGLGTMRAWTPRGGGADADAAVGWVASRAVPWVGRRPFGWPMAGVAPGVPLAIGWPGHRGSAGPALLRLTVAVDDRQDRLLEVRSAAARVPLGRLVVRCADPHQRFGLALDARAAALALDEGVEVRLLRGTGPLWVFAGAAAPVRHRPHLLPAAGGDEQAELLRRLASVDSVQPFGWMEGCVLDAQIELAAALPAARGALLRAARRHLAMYLPGGRLVYEDPRGRVADDRLYGIEATLPFAALARLDPTHPALDGAVRWWRERADADGCVRDAATTAEGGYTVGWPMAAIARRRGSRELARLAVRQQLVRRERLRHGGVLHLRQLADGRRTFPNWARAHAWHLLGLVRTARALDGLVDTTDLWAAAGRAAEEVAGAQTERGLWHCFVDAPATGPEASGTAGIAAALALGREAGRLDRWAGEAAARAWAGLRDLLTPDGWLAGSSQANKGGEALQRGGYRVVSGSGTGLVGQLAAARVLLARRGE